MIIAVVLAWPTYRTVVLDTQSSHDIPINGIASAVQTAVHAIREGFRSQGIHTPKRIATKSVASDSYISTKPGDAEVVRCSPRLAVIGLGGGTLNKHG